MKTSEIVAVLMAAMLSTAIVWPDKVRAAANSLGEFFINGDEMNKPLSKTEALKTMLLSPDSVVYKCHQVELTDKLTLVKKKQ